MVRKPERTLELYMRAGAGMRLYKSAGNSLFNDICKVLSPKDQDILVNAMNKIDKVCSRAEDNMFSDHPQLSCEYIDVFYGSTDDKPKNDVDGKVIKMAREVADGLFKREGN